MPPEFPCAVSSLVPVSGGDLNDAFCARLTDGSRVFVKTARGGAVAGTFQAEAAALEWIGSAHGAPPVPEAVAVGEEFLALEWIDPPPRDDGAFGAGLAALHRAGAPAFGARPPGVVGPLVLGPLALDLSPGDNWANVYCQCLLLPLAARAARQGALSTAGVAAVEAICGRLDALAGPPEPVARLHGDLWSGNALGPYLIDPASYGGHREVDLAMMALFGGFSARCVDAYDEAFPLAEGWRERAGLWQLLPLLIHAVLFGGGYGARVEATARGYL